MSTRYNYTGGLVTEGLILNLDAAKADSYPGSGTVWKDISGEGNNGTLINGPVYTGVAKDAAFVFDGVNDYATRSNPVNFPVNSNLSVFSFFKKTGSNSEPHLCIISTGHSSWNLLLLNQTTLTFNQAFIKTIISGSQILDNQWYYAGCIKEGNVYRLYLNGVINSTVTDSVVFTNNNKYDISSDTGLSSTRNAYFKGLIPIIQVYNYSLSPFDIFQNFNSLKGRYGIPDLVTDGLVLNLDAGNPYSYLQGISGTTWTDVSGNGNNGTLINGTSYSNGAMVFDGVDDYVQVPYTSSLNSDRVTVNAWINKTQAVNFSHFIGLPVNNVTWSPPYMSYGVEYIGTSNTISFVMGFTDNTFAYTNFTLSFGNNQWFNFTASYDKTSVKIYINGVLVATRSESKTMYQSTADFYVGAINTSAQYPLNGKIGVTQVYNKALSASEVQQNFQALRGRYGI